MEPSLMLLATSVLLQPQKICCEKGPIFNDDHLEVWRPRRNTLKAAFPLVSRFYANHYNKN